MSNGVLTTNLQVWISLFWLIFNWPYKPPSDSGHHTKLKMEPSLGCFCRGVGDRKKVPVQRTLALISAAWICTRETKAVGQPSPSYIVGKQKLSGQHTAELLALLSRLTSSKKKKNQSWQTRNKLEWNMDEPPKHPSIEAQLFGLGCANSVEHTGRHKAFFMVWCLKDWFLLGPKRHWSRRLCHWTISFQDETLQNEAVPPLLGPVSQNAALTQAWVSRDSLCCYQTLFVWPPGCFPKPQKLISL